MTTWQGMAAAGLLLAGGGAQAALVDAGNGLVNDTGLDITWVAEAGVSTVQLGGAATWEELVNGAAGLEDAGYDDWRLASMSVAAGTPTGSAGFGSIIDCETDTETNCRDNELGYMYRYYLPGNYGDDKTGEQTVGDVTLTGIQNLYWSGTDVAGSPSRAWLFNPGVGFQGYGFKSSEHYGWAVRPGQIPTAPLPGTAALMALGLAGLGARRLSRRPTHSKV